MNDIQFEQTVCMYGRDILRFCRITAGNDAEGDELYQDTMLKLLEKKSKLKKEQNIKSYALSISILLWKNKKRKYARRMKIAPSESMEVLREEGMEAADEKGMNPEEALLQKEQTRIVREKVAALPAKYRIPITLFYAAGMSVGDIAEHMNLPEGTVKSRLFKAKKLLKEQLQEL